MILTCILRVLLAVLCLGNLGCALGYATKQEARSSQPVKTDPMEVFVQSGIGRYAGAKLGVTPFEAPVPAADAAPQVGQIYLQELLRMGVFSQVKMIAYPVTSDEEAIWWGRQEGCDLIMRGSVTYLLDGLGAAPTQLHVTVRILDARTGNVSWDLLQKAYSEPGYDIDLFWTTMSGAPAQRYPLLARTLAEQLSGYLADPDEYWRKEKAGKRWLFF